MQRYRDAPIPLRHANMKPVCLPIETLSRSSALTASPPETSRGHFKLERK